MKIWTVNKNAYYSFAEALDAAYGEAQKTLDEYANKRAKKAEPAALPVSYCMFYDEEWCDVNAIAIMPSRDRHSFDKYQTTVRITEYDLKA